MESEFLAATHEIARAHGGGVGAVSKDGVTTVWFSLVLRPDTLEPPGASPAGMPGSADDPMAWVIRSGSSGV